MLYKLVLLPGQLLMLHYFNFNITDIIQIFSSIHTFIGQLYVPHYFNFNYRAMLRRARE